MDKIKEYAMITVMALSFMLITGVAKSEEKTYTPQETLTAFAEVPGKLGNHFKNEWSDIKDHQAKSWAEAKKQWQSLLNKFVKTESNQ
jgi:hypothetical protein